MLSIKSHRLIECLLAFIPLEVAPYFQEGVLYAYWGGAYNEKERDNVYFRGFLFHTTVLVSIKFKTTFRSLTVSWAGTAPIDRLMWKGASPRTAEMLLRGC